MVEKRHSLLAKALIIIAALVTIVLLILLAVNKQNAMEWKSNEKVLNLDQNHLKKE